MALRYIRKIGDPILYKKAKYVDKIDDHVIMILDDMAETMYNADGVGLAANQIGILRRLVVVDVGDGLIELINPEIILEEGEQIGKEGCLSVPNVTGEVKRPKKVRVRYQDRTGEYKEIEGEDFLARALSHEIDHLNGILFVNKAIRIINDEEEKMEAE
ncbi:MULTISPECIES: peptide deformylase [unclassified Thermoanaerobacterium]|jgi:peptide deformylase|uniref:peptide deformylase n=1 Tax=unclassified Thermoanaerobacterium TaxID=2622527 RepID=UPI000A148C4E|nr:MULTISPECIES: peptide deformylase [unclassified Thermoanaerobacterium]MDE4541903.1 peptide deformylase [Thermoanaerobacterium sp. R66]ORX24306.1 peptide deformylase [Thermoanaerobacterium sp. PSU-2]HHV73304.1 peptide deformylase [Thermoanaerobacterium sp.]